MFNWLLLGPIATRIFENDQRGVEIKLHTREIQ